jgi:AraC-like DNA-binding protein
LRNEYRSGIVSDVPDKRGQRRSLFGTVSSRALHRARLLGALPDFLESRGVSAAIALSRAGLTTAQVGDPLGTIARAQFVTVTDVAARLLGDYGFALNYAMAMGPTQLGASARAVSLAPTLQIGLRAAQRLVPLFHTHAFNEVIVNGPSVTYSFHLLGSDPQSVAFFVEGAHAVAVRMIRNYIGPQWVPRLVEFAHKPPPGRTLHEDFFGAPVRFNAARSAITFDATLLPVPLAGTEIDGLRVLEGEPRLSADGEERWLDDDRLVEHIERIIDGLLALGGATVLAVARTLGLAPRTLQYRLARRGLSFQELIDKRRSLAAGHLLSNPETSITEVGFILGYSDVAHFTRAFHRWNGMSPRAFRRLLAEARES